MAALTAAMLALQGASALNQFTGQRREAGYDATIANQNASLAEQQANDAIARGAEAEGRSRAQTRQILGTQQAGYAGQGVDVGSGSPVDVAADTAEIGELDAQTIRNNAAREAWGFRTEAANYRTQAANAKARGRDAWTTLLTGGAGMFGTYLQNRTTKSKDPAADGPPAAMGY